MKRHPVGCLFLLFYFAENPHWSKLFSSYNWSGLTVFKAVFDRMGHISHYNMMMGPEEAGTEE